MKKSVKNKNQLDELALNIDALNDMHTKLIEYYKQGNHSGIRGMLLAIAERCSKYRYDVMMIHLG